MQINLDGCVNRIVFGSIIVFCFVCAIFVLFVPPSVGY